MPSLIKIDKAFEEAIKQGVFPGACLAVGTPKKSLFKKHYGWAERFPVERKLSLKTYFDIASLTKPLVTTLLTMMFVEKNLLALDASVSKYFSSWKKEPYGQIQIKHLLQHTSGLPAWKPYFENLMPALIESGNFDEIRKELTGKILKESLEFGTGKSRVYSDLGFILLGLILEKIAEKPLDKLFEEWIAKPLKLQHSFFVRWNQKPKHKRVEFATTSKCLIRRKILAGEVDDPHAWLLGGVAGHAGLFSSLSDLISLAEEILLMDADKSKLIKKETFRRFVDEKIPLGWDTPSPEGSQAGGLFSKNTIGHLGFTGCSIWIDLLKKSYVILLTNRVHLDPKNEQIKLFRPMIHELVLKTFRLAS